MGLPSHAGRRDARPGLARRRREAKRRVRNYSLGMRQRLGIAHALLGDPSVLILDEPANGLDPAGIRWMRGLLKGYADRGGTVLLSSHLLHEVEQIADEMILIGSGRIVARGTREELLSDATGGVATTLVTALDNQQLTEALTEKGCAVHAGRRRAPGRRRAGRRRPRRRRATDRAHRPARRQRGRPRGPLPRAHRRHPARHRQTRPPARCRHERRDRAHDPRRLAARRASRSAASSASSCASWPTPAPAAGC